MFGWIIAEEYTADLFVIEDEIAKCSAIWPETIFVLSAGVVDDVDESLEKEIITARNTWSLADGLYIEYGAQMVEKPRK